MKAIIHGNFLELNKQTPNATICDYCFKDVPDNTDFSLSRIILFRNRLGPSFFLWYNIVMQNVHNVVHAMITKEFASSRGAIHYHSLNYSDQFTSEESDADKCLVQFIRKFR